MTIRKELLEVPHSLRQMSEEGLPLYDALIRRVNWGERPVFMVGSGPSYMAALSGAFAFESLLGMPVIVRRPAVFSAYASRTLAVRSLVIVLSCSGVDEETVQAARKARNRGSIVWAITSDPASELAGLADAVVNYFPGESSPEGARSLFCQHAVMLFLAVAAARVLRPPSPLLNTQEEELGKLAPHAEWVLNQISDAASTLAKEIDSLNQLRIVGGGPFYPVALQTAHHLAQMANVPASGVDLMQFQQEIRQVSLPGSGILYLSSSRCAVKAQVHRSVRESMQVADRRIFALTDRNDRPLSERAELAVLLPVLTEPGGALLALAFLQLVASYAAQGSAQISPRRRHAKKP